MVEAGVLSFHHVDVAFAVHVVFHLSAGVTNRNENLLAWLFEVIDGLDDDIAMDNGTRLAMDHLPRELELILGSVGFAEGLAVAHAVSRLGHFVAEMALVVSHRPVCVATLATVEGLVVSLVLGLLDQEVVQEGHLDVMLHVHVVMDDVFVVHEIAMVHQAGLVAVRVRIRVIERTMDRVFVEVNGLDVPLVVEAMVERVLLLMSDLMRHLVRSCVRDLVVIDRMVDGCLLDGTLHVRSQLVRSDDFVVGIHRMMADDIVVSDGLMVLRLDHELQVGSLVMSVVTVDVLEENVGVMLTMMGLPLNMDKGFTMVLGLEPETMIVVPTVDRATMEALLPCVMRLLVMRVLIVLP